MAWKYWKWVVPGLCLVLVLLGRPAGAWELTLRGEAQWDYKYYSQMGRAGFFGPFDVDATAPELGIFNFASLNAWLGSELAEGFRLATVSTGSDAAVSTQEMDLYPEFRVNEAIKVRGKYHVGAWNDDVPELLEPLRLGDIGIGRLEYSRYRNSSFPGVRTSFSPGYWDLLWVTAKMPIGTLGFGKRPWSFGCGLMFNGAENTSIESMNLDVPYGPFRFGGFFYPWRQSPLAQNYGSTYLDQTDKNDAASVWVGGYAIYESGPFSIGFMNQYVTAHAGAESQWVQIFKDVYIGADLVRHNGSAYAKFNNGRFFFNAEVAWYDEILRRRPNSLGLDYLALFGVGGVGSFFAPQYIEHWRYMAELGAFAGPAKLSVLFAMIPGPDRRNGVLIDRQPALLTTNRIFFEFNKELTSTGVFRPYSLLMSTNYGGGLNSISKAREGHMNDANVIAGRLDYAMAANLNSFVSIFWAERQSKGYGWGLIRPIPVLGILYTPPAGPGGFGLVQPPINALNTLIQGLIGGAFPAINAAPAIPDSSLGVEVDAGFEWQLLDQYNLCANFGVWWPGKWFNYACTDKSNPGGWFLAEPGNNWGVVNPNRTIDPIFGAEISIKTYF